MDPYNPMPRFLKIGNLHSPANLKERAEYFEQKYGGCMKAEISNRNEEDSPLKSLTYYQRHPQKGFNGFDFHFSYFKKFNMIQEMIEECEMHEQFTSDEESISDGQPQRVYLPMDFNSQQGLTFEGEPIQYSGVDYYSSDDDESSHRPVSRLSLEVDEKFDESGSEYDSDYFFCESEGEGEDNPQKKVVYGPVVGITVGAVWRTRQQCSRSSVHVPCRSRIHAGVKAGCSIVLSSKEMVDDEGVLFTYKSKAKLGSSGNIMTHQLVGANKALQNNFLKRIPIRVIRGYQLGNPFAPKKGYRYDGLYDVKAIIDGSVENGNQYCEVHLVRCPNQPPPPWATNTAPAGDIPVHLLSTTEIDYNTGDESESIESDNRESPETPCYAAEYLLDTRSKSSPIVVLERLTVAEIEKWVSRKEPPRTSPKRPRESKKTVSEKRSRSSRTSKNTDPILQQKSKVRLKAANKTTPESSSESDSTSSKRLKKDISKGNTRRKARKSTKSSSLKQKDNLVSSNSRKERLSDGKNITSGTKKMAVNTAARKASTEQELAQSNRGVKLRSSGKKKR